MVAEMIIRIPDYVDREKDLQISHKKYESFGIPEDLIQAAARWRQVAELTGLGYRRKADEDRF